MKFLSIFLSLGVFNLAGAKESLADLGAIKEYRENQANHVKSDLPPGKLLSDLITKIKDQPDSNIPLGEILFALSNARNSPSADLIPKLKTIWLHYRKSTFRATSPDDWRFIKALDSNQVICDEVKILVKSMGGNLDDIEPLDERNTYELNEIRRSLRAISEAPGSQPLPVHELRELAKKISVIVKKCRFDASNEDDKLHLFYVLEIIQLLGTQRVWTNEVAIEVEDPVIVFYDEVLSKGLARIDENWIPGSSDQISGDPSPEQMIERRENYFEGYQQMNLRKIRDLILLSVSKLIELKKSDEVFKQEMFNRFSKDNACRKAIENHLNSSK